MELKSILRVLREQVSNFLIINFKIRSSDQELSLLRVSLNSLEDILKRSRHDTFLNGVSLLTCHGMSLTSTSLSVSEDCSVVSLQNILDDIGGAIIIDILLRHVPIKGHIEGELLGWCIVTGLLNEDFSSVRININNNIMSLCHFILAHWSAPDGDLYGLGVLLGHRL